MNPDLLLAIDGQLKPSFNTFFFVHFFNKRLV